MKNAVWQQVGMRALILALALISASPAGADTCDALARQVTAAAGATIRTKIGPAYKLIHPGTESMQVDCEGGRITRVSGTKDGAGSMQPMAKALGAAAMQAFDQPEQAVLGVMLQCIRSASAKAGAMADAAQGALRADCYVLRDFVTMEVKWR